LNCELQNLKNKNINKVIYCHILFGLIKKIVNLVKN
jgi:hypothetical protein